MDKVNTASCNYIRSSSECNVCLWFSRTYLSVGHRIYKSITNKMCIHPLISTETPCNALKHLKPPQPSISSIIVPWYPLKPLWTSWNTLKPFRNPPWDSRRLSSNSAEAPKESPQTIPNVLNHHETPQKSTLLPQTSLKLYWSTINPLEPVGMLWNSSVNHVRPP